MSIRIKGRNSLNGLVNWGWAFDILACHSRKTHYDLFAVTRSPFHSGYFQTWLAWTSSFSKNLPPKIWLIWAYVNTAFPLGCRTKQVEEIWENLKYYYEIYSEMML